jgi:hypothetical protein
MAQNKKTLGDVIYATLQNFYPNTSLGITVADVDEILKKAEITKKNVKKEEITKIIKILRTHIEQALVTKNPVPVPVSVPVQEERKFFDMEKTNNNMDKLNMEYYDNLEKMRQQDITINNKKELTKIEERQNDKEEIINYFIVIDSHCRNIENYENAADYTVSFTNTRTDMEDSYSIPINKDLNNVKSIQLMECMISDNLFNGDYYIILEIEEAGKNLSSNNQALNNCFTRLLKYNEIESYKGKYRIYDIPEDAFKEFTPEKNFSSLSIRLKNSKGELLVFNREQDGVEPLLNSFKFKISKKEKSMTNSIFA